MVNRALQIYSQRLRELRESRYSSRDDFSESLDLHPATVGRWERGERLPSAEELNYIAEATGMPLAWFFLEEGQRIENGEKTVTPREALAVLAEMVDGAPEKSADEKFYIAHVDTSHYSRRRAKSRKPKTERKEKS